MRSLITLAVFVLAGCTPTGVIDETDTDVVADTDTDTDSDTDTDTDSDTDTDTSDACKATIVSISPINNANNIALDAVVTATFSEAVAADDFTLKIDKVAGKATLAADGKSATFDPDADLATETRYTITATACEDAETASFTTVEAPLVESELVGRTYALDFSTVTWVKPASASFFASELGIEWLLTQVVAWDGTSATLDASGAVGQTASSGGIGQAQCFEVLTYDDADFSKNPTFTAGPTTLTAPVDATTTVTIENFKFTGTFAAGGDELVDITITGLLDTRAVDVLLDQDTCSLVAFLGDKCVACGDGKKKCLDTEMTADQATWIPDLDIDESYDPAADPACF